MRHLTQPFLESLISYTWLTFQLPWWDWSVDLFLMMSYCDMLDLTILGVFDQYYLLWDSFWLLVESQWILWFILRYFMVTHWEPMDIVIYHWYGYYYLFWDTLWLLIESWWILWLSLMPSVANKELLWSWLSFDAFQLLVEIDVIIVDYLLMFSSHLYRTKVILYDY